MSEGVGVGYQVLGATKFLKFRVGVKKVKGGVNEGGYRPCLFHPRLYEPISQNSLECSHVILKFQSILYVPHLLILQIVKRDHDTLLTIYTIYISLIFRDHNYSYLTRCMFS